MPHPHARASSLPPLRLICPRCRHADRAGVFHLHPLVLPGDSAFSPARLSRGLERARVLECSNRHCRARYPVIEGIPVIFRDPDALSLALNPPVDLLSLGADRLVALVEGQSPENALASQLARLARYALAAFPDVLHPAERALELFPLLPGQTLTAHGADVAGWLESLGEHSRLHAGPRISLGCALGREAWAFSSGPTVLVDAHLPSLLFSRRLEREGMVSFPIPLDLWRWTHLAIDLPAPTIPVARVCCDVLDPPFEAEVFGSVLALNLVDSVSDPTMALGQAHALTHPSGLLTLTSPFAWRSEVTAKERWLERIVPGRVSGEEALRLLLARSFSPPMEVVARQDFVWLLRSSAREAMLYRSVGICAARPPDATDSEENSPAEGLEAHPVHPTSSLEPEDEALLDRDAGDEPVSYADEVDSAAPSLREEAPPEGELFDRVLLHSEDLHSESFENESLPHEGELEEK